MANNYNLGVDLTAVLAGIVTIDTVVDDIRAVDVPAIQTGLLTEKNKHYVGISGQPALTDYFQDVADGAVPNVNKWNVVETNDGAVTVDITDPEGFCKILAGTVNNNDSSINTNDIYAFGINKVVSSIKLKCELKVVDLTGQFGVGLVGDITGVFWHQMKTPLCIYGDNDVIVIRTSDGAIQEETDVSAHISDDTWLLIEATWIAGSVIVSLDGTVRATHVTRVPATMLRAMEQAINQNGIQSDLRLKYIEVWPE